MLFCRFLASLLLIVPLTLRADLSSSVVSGIDALVNQAMQADGIPGLAVAVTQNGRVVFLKGYGTANNQLSEAVSPNTLFGLGSVSKVFTAFAIMQLVEQGKVNLDDSILKYIPDAPQEWQSVTIRELLSHTSGIPQHEGPHLPWTNVWSQLTMEPMQFAPGTAFKYNNFGFILLDRVVEVASGESFSNYINDKILSPLRMQDTSIPTNLHPDNLATGYRKIDGQIFPIMRQRPWVQMWGSGGIVSNVQDMANWDLAMYQGKLLSADTYRLMWTPVFLKNGQPSGANGWSWALGWQVSYRNNKLVVWKDGAIAGYSSFIIRHIDDNITVILLANTNKTHLHKLANQIFREVKWQGQPPQQGTSSQSVPALID